MTGVRALVVHAVLALFAAAAGLAVAPAFGGALTPDDFAPGALVVAVVVGALLPAAAVALARRRELDATLAAAAGLVVLVLGVVVATRPGTAVFSGAYRLLTSALPAEADGPACATVGFVVGACSLVSALLVAHSGAPVLAVLPPFVALTAALALDAGIRPPPVWSCAVLVVLLGAALALLRDLTPRRGTVVGAVAILAAGAVLGPVLAPDLPAVKSRPADARNLVEAPIRPRDAVNPMLQYPALANGTERVRFTGTASRPVDRLTLVTLDQFTGRTWATSAGYRRAGNDLGSGPDTATPVTVDVRARQAASLTWLLRPDRPTALDRDGLGVDESTGDIVVPAGRRYPSSYRVTGSRDVRPTGALAGERVVATTESQNVQAARTPKAIRDFARFARVGRSDLQVLQILQNRLQGADFYVDDTATPRAGNGFFQLSALLAGTGRHLGTSEQYASAFAVMARVLGYGSRLVLGFRPDFGRDGRSFTVTGQDVRAWAQVRFAGAGWVTFDATPSRTASKAREANQPDTGQSRPSASSSNSTSAPPTPPTPTPSGSTAPQSATQDADSTGLVVVLVALLIVLLLATPPGVKAGRRRRRRGAAVPAHAIHGAWRETTDRLAEAGRPPQRGLTTDQTVAAAPRPARDDVRALGRLLDRAGYAPEDAGPEDARSAWAHADSAGARIRGTLPGWRRVLAVLDPRPLWRR